jgi:hypothetical protein
MLSRACAIPPGTDRAECLTQCWAVLRAVVDRAEALQLRGAASPGPLRERSTTNDPESGLGSQAQSEAERRHSTKTQLEELAVCQTPGLTPSSDKTEITPAMTEAGAGALHERLLDGCVDRGFEPLAVRAVDAATEHMRHRAQSPARDKQLL